MDMREALNSALKWHRTDVRQEAQKPSVLVIAAFSPSEGRAVISKETRGGGRGWRSATFAVTCKDAAAFEEICCEAGLLRGSQETITKANGDTVHVVTETLPTSPRRAGRRYAGISIDPITHDVAKVIVSFYPDGRVMSTVALLMPGVTGHRAFADEVAKAGLKGRPKSCTLPGGGWSIAVLSDVPDVPRPA